VKNEAWGFSKGEKLLEGRKKKRETFKASGKRGE